jgi:hypothetical protein
VVQEKVHFPREANGYYGVVSTADSEVVVSLQDRMNSLKKKASAHQLLGKNGDIIPC